MTECSIRPARPEDLETLGRLGANLMRVHYAFDRERFLAPGDNPEAGYQWFLETQLGNAEACLLVAERDAAIVGYVYAAAEPLSWKELRDKAGYIHDIYVEDAGRSVGVGAQLLEQAIAWLKDRGMPRVLLWTAAPNARARALFEAHGFRATMVEMTKEL
jgi:ribosomal protein S18 acetylase RimI-like enzyme